MGAYRIRQIERVVGQTCIPPLVMTDGNGSYRRKRQSSLAYSNVWGNETTERLAWRPAVAIWAPCKALNGK